MTASSPIPPIPTITVIGHGHREVRPDQVDLHFTLAGIYPSVHEAEVGLQARRTELWRALEAFRSLKTRLTAGEPSIGPHHDYEERRQVFKGFRATDHLVLRAPLEPHLVTNILQAVSGQLESLTFRVRYFSKKSGAVCKSARAEAVRNARRKAAQYAEAAGHRLGTLRSLSDTDSADVVVERSTSGVFEHAPVSIEPSPEIVNAQVRAVWELV